MVQPKREFGSPPCTKGRNRTQFRDSKRKDRAKKKGRILCGPFRNLNSAEDYSASALAVSLSLPVS